MGHNPERREYMSKNPRNENPIRNRRCHEFSPLHLGEEMAPIPDRAPFPDLPRRITVKKVKDDQVNGSRSPHIHFLTT